MSKKTKRKATKKTAVAKRKATRVIAAAMAAELRSAPRRKRAKRKAAESARGRLHISLAVPSDLAIDGPGLDGLTVAQRLELAAMGKRRGSPTFVTDAALWAQALR